MRRIVMTLALLVGVGAAAQGQDRRGEALAALPAEAAAQRLVETLGERTIAAVRIADKNDRRRAMLEAAAGAMDFRAIAKAVLGYANVPVPAQREAEIHGGVAAFVAREVMNEIDRVAPEQMAKVSAKAGAADVRVSMVLAGANGAIDALWVVRRIEDAWRITDILVGGQHSLIVHFGGVLARRAKGEVEQLADFLRSETKKDSVSL